MPEDLWPESIAKVAIRAPVAILKEQAANLSNRTKHVLEGEVVSEPQGNSFSHRFLLVLPSLNYRYELFTVFHGVKIYPLNIWFVNNGIDCADEAAFIDSLRRIFNHDHTRQVVESLLAQAKP